MRSFAVVLWFTLSLSGCSGGPPDDLRDADAGAEVPLDPSIEAPAPPEAPRLTCPEGWPMVDGVCDLPVRSAAACDFGARRTKDGCVAIAPPCPAGGFPEAVPEPAYFVRRGASTTSDGSRERPFPDLFQALAVAHRAGGGTVVLAPGEYEGHVVLEDGLHVLGACLDVVLTGFPVAGRGAVESQGPDARVENLTIRNPPQRGAQVLFENNALHLRGVWIEGGQEAALNVGRGATLTAENVVVRAAGGAVGLVVQEASQATLRGVEIRDAFGTGVRVAGAGTRVSLTDVLVADTVPQTESANPVLVTDRGTVTIDSLTVSGSAGRGVWVAGGALTGAGLIISDVTRTDLENGVPWAALTVSDDGRAELRRLAIDAVDGTGIRVGGLGSELELHTAHLRARGGDPRPETRQVAPSGVVLARGSRSTLRDIVIEGPFGTGMTVGANNDVADVWVRQLRDLRGERAVGVAPFGVTQPIRRVRVSDFAGVAVLVSGSGLVLEDVEVEAIRGVEGENGLAGGGIWAIGAEATVRRGRFRDVFPSGFAVVDDGGRLVAEDIVVDDTSSLALAERGYHPAIAAGIGELTLRRFQVRGASGWAISLDGTQLNASDLVIADTLPVLQSWAFGWGVGFEALGGSQVRLERAHVEGSQGTGLFAAGSGTRVELDYVTIANTQERSCAGPGQGSQACDEEPGGMGLGVYRGAEVSGQEVSVLGADFCGLHVGPEGRLELRSGRVARAEIGACVHPVDFDLGQITQGVVFEASNGISVESNALAAPEVPPRPSLAPPADALPEEGGT